jgi:type III secretion system chaperone SycN
VNALADVLAQFTAELGMGPAPADPDQPAIFRFERNGRLFLEQQGERILVYLEGPERARDSRALRAALAACDVRQRRPLPVRAGLTADDRLVFGIAFEDNDFTLQALHAALDLLMKLHADVATGAAAP